MKEIDPVRDLLPLKNRLFGLARSIVGSPQEAEDITGDILLRLWERRAALDVRDLEAYALAATRNLALDSLRRSERRNASLDELPALGEMAASAPLPDRRAEQRESLECVARLIEGLPEKQRTVLRLRDIEELSYSEIAEATGLTQADVRTSLFRARQHLRQAYQKLQDS